MVVLHFVYVCQDRDYWRTFITAVISLVFTNNNNNNNNNNIYLTAIGL